MDRHRETDALRAGFSGALIEPGDAEYDEARGVFNAMYDRHPAVIARCTSTSDVVAAVTVAREQQMVVAVRCGGHSVAGLGVCDDGMVIDLRGIRHVHVDPRAKIARAGGGALWGEFDAATQAYGLHTPGGRISTTGVGGFTLGGGYGWSSSKYGLTSDNLVAATVVLADGSVVTASETENADLFWGIRGGGGNFGVVTEFAFQLHELGPLVLAGLQLWPLAHAGEVLPRWRDYVDQAPDELSTAVVTITAPPEPFVPEHMQGQLALGMAVLYVGDPAEGASVVEPLKELGATVDIIGQMPYVAFQAALDGGAPKGLRQYWRGEYMRELSDDAIATYVDRAPDVAAAGMPFSQMLIFRIGQAVAKVPDDATAFSHRDANYLFHPISCWSDPAHDDDIIAANRRFAEAMRPYTTGATYLNFTAEDRAREAFGEAKYARLVAIKDKYDPHNLFRLNQNIKPSKPTGEPALAP